MLMLLKLNRYAYENIKIRNGNIITFNNNMFSILDDNSDKHDLKVP